MLSNQKGNGNPEVPRIRNHFGQANRALLNTAPRVSQGRAHFQAHARGEQLSEESL